ncbi:MAG TPA: glutaredoxin, partial [Aigarchaeota archaeon]|nr:glutaredoxin [Aigarchaeota archaeon]
MAILKERDKKAVKDKFEKELENDVKLIVFTQEFECEYCAVTRELMEELASLTNRIKLTVYDFEKDKDKAEKWRVDKIPALLIFGEKEYGIRYFGVPSGYEFAALLDDIVDVSRRRSRLSKATVDRLKDVNEPVHIQVFVTPTC